MKPILSKTAKQVLAAVDALSPALLELHAAIHQNPEVGLQEYQASARLGDFLEREGFKVRRGVAKLPTAFRADAGDSKRRPRPALLCEYDALPGLGHACGHSIIAAASAGAGAALHRACPGLPVTVMGTPAEELGLGKAALIKAGAFKGVDLAMMVHPSSRRQTVRLFLGLVQRIYTFHGRAAHAAAFPDQGINALDAVITLYNAVSALRQQLPEQVRVHSIITDGGKAPNIIPERAQAFYVIRALDLALLAEVEAKVNDCARAAAQATGTRLELTHGPGFHPPLKVNRALAGAYEDQVIAMGLEPHRGPEDKNIGSSDVSNLSHVMPVIHPHVPIVAPPAVVGIHSREFEAAAGGQGGQAAVIEGARLLALTALSVIERRPRWEAIQREFKSSRQKVPPGLA
jgi:amidohydrolase